jgi:WD40 repeat protein
MKVGQRGLAVLGLLLAVGLVPTGLASALPEEPTAPVRLAPRQCLLHDAIVHSVVWSPDGKLLASLAVDGTVRLWDSATTEQVATFEGFALVGISNIAFSPDGKVLAIPQRNWVVLWDIATGKEKSRLEGDLDRVTRVAFSPDGKTLATTSLDKAICLWDLATGKQRLGFQGHTYEALSVAFSPDGKTLASVGALEWWVTLWNTQTGERRATLGSKGEPRQAVSVMFSPDGKTLAVGREGELRLWDVQTDKAAAILKGPLGFYLSVAFSPDGKLVAAGGGVARGSGATGNPGLVELWDTQTGGHLATLEGHPDVVSSVAFSPDGKTLASGSADKTILFWDVPMGK